MQLQGISLNQRSISRIELGQRIVTDFELLGFIRTLNIELSWLIVDFDRYTKEQE